MAKRVYLSMAMIGHEEQMDRSKILKGLLRDAGFDVFDPYEVDITGWEDGQIVANDLYEVLRSDVLVADLTRPSYGGGTFGELYCAATKKIPSLVIIPDERCGPWLRTFTTTQATPTVPLEVLVEIVKNLSVNGSEGGGSYAGILDPTGPVAQRLNDRYR